MNASISRIAALLFFSTSVLIGNSLYAQDAWEFQASGMIRARVSIGDDVIYVAGGQILHALEFDGSQRWQKDLGAVIAANLSLDGDTLYVHSAAGLHALDQSGEQKWFFAKTDEGPLVAGESWGWGQGTMADPWGWYRSGPLVGDGRVYFGSTDGLYAVSASDGAQIWHAPMGPVTTDPVSFNDSVIVGSWDNRLYAVSAETGKEKWAFEAQVLGRSGSDWIGYYGFHLNPVIHGEGVFAGARGTYFYHLDAETGKEVWSVKVATSWIGSPAVVTDSGVYFGLSDGQALLGFDLKNGAQNTFFKTGSLVFAQPGFNGDKLIAGSLSGQLFQLDPASGEGKQIKSLTDKSGAYQSYFDPKVQPKGMSPYQASVWSIEQFLTDFNAILNVRVHEGVAYLSTASGTLYAVPL